MTEGDRKETMDAPGADEATGQQALALIDVQRTMVLSTRAADDPWAAPVYYVYSAPGFYFFSSPRARHIEQGLSGHRAAAAIFIDSDRWEDIQGVQMAGVIKEVTQLAEQLKISARFLWKFPFARPFLQDGPPEAGGSPRVGGKVRLYQFLPYEVFYTNNRLGFGRRIPLTLVG
ncbi:MAG: pyridoxamine 5'-phosphate oxidase family protein [Desulfatitalea sp.]